MTTPTQMGAEPRPEPTPAARQQEAEAPRRVQPQDDTAPQQMGATLLRDWASI